MLKRLGHLLLILALLSATGMHWGVLQSIAWAAMLARNVEQVPFSAAIERTFDGNHPCPICRAIAKGERSEKKSDLQSESQRLEFVNHLSVLFIEAPRRFHTLGESNLPASVLMEAPPTPPPRALA